MKVVAPLHVLQAADHVSLMNPLITSCVGHGRDSNGKAGDAIGSELLEYGSNCWHID